MIQIRIPQEVKQNARIALQLKKNNYKGGTDTGINRARQLSRNKYISHDDAKTMKAWFARHVKTSRPGYIKWLQSGKPANDKNKSKYRGAVAWLLWGGDEGKRWIDNYFV